MTIDFQNIETLIRTCQLDEAISLLNDAVADAASSDSDKAHAYYLLGNAYRKQNNWRQAINNYCQAMELNPDGPAAEAYRAANDVLNFFNHDLYNP